ncbi:DUF6368 family protein [Streptomyces sp. NPDC012450]|uniref:DUF6368 family protein n=1 Tax=Streptomyces sp. NPDC012450 TaxID=3364834 RepID=UPI0036E28DFD
MRPDGEGRACPPPSGRRRPVRREKRDSVRRRAVVPGRGRGARDDGTVSRQRSNGCRTDLVEPGPDGTGTRLLGGCVSGPAVGLWLFEPREFEDVLADVAPRPESFCEPVETRVGSGLDFWVRDGPAVGLPAWGPTGVGVLFLSEDEETPAEDEDYPAIASRTAAPHRLLGPGEPSAARPPAARRTPRRVDRLRRPAELSQAPVTARATRRLRTGRER